MSKKENGKLQIDSIGYKYRKLNGKLQIDSNGDKTWYVNGVVHRLDGPAMIDSDGNKRWFLNDKEYTEEEFNKLELVIDIYNPILYT